VNTSSPRFTEAGAIRAVWRVLGFWVVVGLVGAMVEAIAIPLAELTPLIALAREHRVVLSFWWDVLAIVIGTALSMRLLDGGRASGWSLHGLGRDALSARALGTGFAFGAVAMLVPAALFVATGRFSFTRAFSPESWWSALAIALVQLVPAAFNEELLFRGYFLTAVRDGAGAKWAVILTSATFGALHLMNPDPSGLSIANVALAGVMLAVVRYRFDSLWVAFAAHLGWNLVQVSVLHAPVSGLLLPNPGYVLVDHGPRWLTGGSWGPEGGLGASLALLVTIFLLLRRSAGSPDVLGESAGRTALAAEYRGESIR
jgi:membrane protease YdiL (CAAX protease family)